MGKDWQNKRKNEHFYKKAKEEGYRSRASYKLRQLNDKYDLIQEGNVVVDLGAAPGGWLQVAMEEVGNDGFVLGVDLEPVEELGGNSDAIQADIVEVETEDLVRERLPEGADVIVSDASPDISGIWDVDQARSVELARATMNLARGLLKPGGNVLVKVFQGEMFNDFLKEAKINFEFCKSSKPGASRDESAEIYVVGKGFRFS